MPSAWLCDQRRNRVDQSGHSNARIPVLRRPCGHDTPDDSIAPMLPKDCATARPIVKFGADSVMQKSRFHYLDGANCHFRERKFDCDENQMIG